MTGRARASRRPSLLLVAPLGGSAILVAVAALNSSVVVETLVLVVLGVVVAVLASALHAARRSRLAAQQCAADLAAALESARDATVLDEDTGLLNRQGVLLVARHVLESARRSGGAVHCCVVEVTPAVVLGGPGGAQGVAERVERTAALRAAAAAALRNATRSSDVVGADETGRFLVVGPGTGLHAQELERRMRAGLAEQRHAERAAGGLVTAIAERQTVDVGAAVLAPWDEGDVDDLLARAEKALQQRRALRTSAPQAGWGRRRADIEPH
ncbi:GGDEF domain-containing protein [Kineococcus xinjiangensis]|uniref:GGDEF domain-containing protein n=1 Tax=Kineococcus xinjiangensis TaxID=512762 RepID=A0A2S6IIY3_9ACTN|nr:GGDEF domain-containing protein [Kineococcus xinjiangensis]